ncbi:unnamed protein product [Leptidea sinapis]|uniref:Protein krueppel n=1 Tax=Leptidea sinapis TaxID=189913 RepID=A0A5E4QFB2_9NEOP|nr:unnamed protein product [Leptidea sinapis]
MSQPPLESIRASSCRICLATKKPLCPLFRYKLAGNYAEMLTAIADIKVLPNDGLPEKICTKCCTILERAYILKSTAERSDKMMRKIISHSKTANTKKIVFSTITDIKAEIAPLVKVEPKWELDVLPPNTIPSADNINGNDIVIANTVIRKVENCKKDSQEIDELDEDFFNDTGFDNDDDDDYLPPKTQKLQLKFKKPKLNDVKVFKTKKGVVRSLKINKFKTEKAEDSGGDQKNTVQCFPLLRNGTRGPPILLKRPKDATVIRLPAYNPKVKPSIHEGHNGQKQKEKMVCPICGILTSTLGNHIATHEEKKKFNCTECSRSFAHKSNMVIHMKKHTGIKDHICEICGSGFYSQKSLIRHNLIHKNERPFQCDLCSKKFIVRCDLNRHLRIHAGYKPYKCSTCTMSFNAKHQLQNHERMHTGERPYTCQVCSVAFSYKVNLNNHVAKTHGVNLKFKSIHTVTDDVLRREMGIANETREAIAHILPHLTDRQADLPADTLLTVPKLLANTGTIRF